MKRFAYKIIFFLLSAFLTGNSFSGYTLIDPLGNNRANLIDNDLNVVHSWDFGSRPASMPYLFPDRTILRPGMAEIIYMNGQSVGGLIQIFDWYSENLWTYVLADNLYQQHHDILPMPDGNVLVLVWERIPYEEIISSGRVQFSGEFWPETLIELEPVGETQANIVWMWRLWDHLIQDVNPQVQDYGVVSEHPELLDINYGTVGGDGPFSNNGDWIHANGIDYNQALDQIAISARHTSEIYIIDHSTTTEEAAGHSGGNCGKGGDFLYRWGNPEVYGQGDSTDRRLFYQHDIQWIREGLPGEGKLLVFNNGNERQPEPYSSIEEWFPPLEPDGNYSLNAEGCYGPDSADLVFADPENFYCGFQGGVNRQPNGNSLITYSSNRSLFEVDTEGTVVWEYIDPMNLYTARAHRYSPDYITLDPKGDCNGDGYLDILDISLIIDIILELSEPSDYQEWTSDANEDGTIDILDLVVIVFTIIEN